MSMHCNEITFELLTGERLKLDSKYRLSTFGLKQDLQSNNSRIDEITSYQPHLDYLM